MKFSPEETAACRRLIEIALEEDLGAVGDLTSQALIPADMEGRATLVARTSGLAAGIPAAELVFSSVDSRLHFQNFTEDGSLLQPGDQLATVAGSMRSILSAERTALNFVQHLAGIATQTRHYVEAVRGCTCQILDTRKTTPGWRLLEKYAVRCGGGHNHRMGLHDGLLIKDNHLAFLLNRQGSALNAVVRAARAFNSELGLPLEIEVDDLGQFEEVLACRPDIILLDNMTPQQLEEAVRRRRALAPEVLLEASGGVTLETIQGIARSGVDRISVGALTHSAPALDVALDYLTP